ncbi:PH and SEC7 domain-containing protein 4 isoform X3 [Rhinolophus ferrumequinum]|uniref:PH and SEC7 domain-containing protein 4 isoform X3 n=1 Tax=Rhinolophus ferrumequinum TaxID=59479 RepID=UPI00140FC272|nr:PH and SEC7 domain-containing protein 4 isoform X3 [Rhinolophus ferrumequinum]
MRRPGGWAAGAGAWREKGHSGFQLPPASTPPDAHHGILKTDTPGLPHPCTLWMMGDDRLSEHPKPMGLLNICLEDDVQHPPGVHPKGTPEPSWEHTWASAPADLTRPGAPPSGSNAEPMDLGASPSLGDPRQNQGTSTQVVFWAGILQAQMCVLDLEEELEKTEGLRAGLRSCLPMAPADLPPFSCSHASPRDLGLLPSPPVEEVSGEDSSGPDGEDQDLVWPGKGMPGSSLEWGAEEESVFFDNPLFLESPCSDSASGARFSWGTPDACAAMGLDNPHTLEPPVLAPGDGAPWGLGEDPDGGESIADSSGHTTPPFSVPTYRSHSWAVVDTTDQAPTAPPGDSETPLADGLNPAVSHVDKASIWEKGPVGSNPDPATHHVQPWQALPSAVGWHTEQGPSWPKVPLISQDRGDRHAECPQESAPCISAPSPWGGPAPSPECSSPESDSRGPGSRPSSESSPEGSPRPWGQQASSILPKWTPDAPCPSLLERGGAEPSSLERAAPESGGDVKSEGASQPDVHRTSTEGGSLMTPMDFPRLPESPMSHVQPPEEGQRPQAGDKLANGIGTNKLAWDLASRLYRLEGFRKSEVAAHLRKNDDHSRAVAQEYLSFFQFGGQSLDRALRGFLQALVLSGETQERERVLYQFSRRFHHCNPRLFSSVDSVHTLTCAIMLLNTDLHGQNIGKSMSCQEFISNLNGLQDGGNFPKELLKGLYWSIRSEKLESAVDEEDAARPEEAQLSTLAGKMRNPFLQLAHDSTVPTYKQGILARKMHHDADGKKTPWGKRGWKMFHTLLRGMVLYFLKGEDQGLEGQMVDEPVGVHHSLATPATHYTKKPHVFQLRTADWRLYLFQAPTAKEMSSWIARINLAAATHSAPPFPAAVGSQRRFVRPILPAGPTQSSLEEQHRSHENCLDAASDDLLDLQRNFPERRGRSRELEEYRLRKEYLEHEKTRYEMYVQLLVARLHCPSDDLDLWEEQLGRETGGMQEPKPSLKKSHSSPSLQQDEAPTTAKVKRNISERRTYRKIIPKRNRHQL